MKKYMILLLASLAFTFVACDNDTEPGGTAVEKMAGDWERDRRRRNGAGIKATGFALWKWIITKWQIRRYYHFVWAETIITLFWITEK